ncbi:MAG: SGNH/GDSL hydrolase family protein [Bacteroidota bacterium]
MLELALRLAGFQPGVMDDRFHPVDSLVNEALFQVDASGVTSYWHESPRLPDSYDLNPQGFRSPYSFGRTAIDSLARGKKKVLLIGDSYTEGCCTSSPDSTFGSLLDQREEYLVLNAGIGGTGLTQYQTVAEKYLPLLQPHLVVVPFYLGNDILYYHRPVVREVPAFYTFKGLPWLHAVGDIGFMDEEPLPYLPSPEKAYAHYLNNYTLFGSEAGWFQRSIRQSVLFSQLYLRGRNGWHTLEWAYREYHSGLPEHATNQRLHAIQKVCSQHGIPMLVVPIPAPADAARQQALGPIYNAYFTGINCVFPDIRDFDVSDYDGPDKSNHFNDRGHRHYFHALERVVDQQIMGP